MVEQKTTMVELYYNLERGGGGTDEEYTDGESRCLERSPVVGNCPCMPSPLLQSYKGQREELTSFRDRLSPGLWTRHCRAENRSLREENSS